jgi:hypothetical protein
MLLFNINMYKHKYIKILNIYMLLYLCKSVSKKKKKNSSPSLKILVPPLAVKIYILVATEIGRGLAGAPPFARWWTKSFITKAIWLRINFTVNHSYNDIAFNRSSRNLLRKANEVPWPCCLKLSLFAREHGHYAIH